MNLEDLRIIELQIENFKRCGVITIRPDRGLVIIGGENDQGKSSTVDSIAATLGGADLVPAEPIRRGKRRARTRIDLGEIVVERTYSLKGTTLTVTNADGVPQKSPQALLDSLCSKVTFDPLEFSQSKPKDRQRVLREITGLDFSELDDRRAAAYQQRTDAGRDAKRLEAQLDGLELYSDTPEREVDVAALLEESRQLEAAQRESAAHLREVLLEELRGLEQTQKANDDRRAGLREAELDVTNARNERNAFAARVADLKEQLRAARASLEEWETELSGCEKLRDDRASLVSALVDPDLEAARRRLTEVEIAPSPRIDAIRAEVSAAETVNRRVRANAEHARVSKELAAHQDRVQDLTDTIEGCDAERARRIGEAKFPIAGLGFDEQDATLGGLPWEQASESQRLMASMAVGAALHPKLKLLLVKNGNDLGERKLRELAEIAAKNGLQIILERIAGGPGALIISDGEVVSDGAEAEAANG